MKFRKARIERFIAKNLTGEPVSADDHLRTEQLIGFHEGTAPTRERKHIENHLEQCAFCCELLASVETVDEVAPRDKEGDAPVPWWQRLWQPFVQKKYPVLAAAVAIIFAVILLNRPTSNPYAEHVELTPAPYAFSELRGEVKDEAVQAFREGMQHYQNQKFVQALPFLLKAADTEPQNPQFRFFYGVTLLLAERYENGITHLNDQIVLSSSYREEAQWYAALAYLKLNRPQEAKELLEELSGTSGEFASKAANLLLVVRP